MKTLPNGLTVFNATPHTIRFWKLEWEEAVDVPTDEVISAAVCEAIAEVRDIPPAIDNLNYRDLEQGTTRITLVHSYFLGTDEGDAVLGRAAAQQADVVIGSIIAAQAYPELVVAMTPAPGYERVPPAEKRMNPDKFTVFVA